MRTNKKLAGVAAVGAFALSLSIALPANADYAPSSTDVVGVAGDTPQYDFNFAADGNISGDLGYNAANNVNKWVSFDATPDANGRSGFVQGSTVANEKPLNPTITLRAGTAPVQRPPSTTTGIQAFLSDNAPGVPHKIDYLRTGRVPTALEQQTAQTNGWGYLHVVKIATDKIQIAVANNSNAPAGLSTSDLIGIYQGTITKWNQIPGNSAGSNETIVPLIPPASSVVRTTLLNTLKAANGGATIVLAGNVGVVQQNDPTTITGLSAADQKNALVSFSLARLNLFNDGYFHDPSYTFPGGPSIAPGVKVLTGNAQGNAPSGAAAYSDTIGHYVLFRQSDASLSGWQPGSTKNWSQVLFSDSSGTPFFKKSAGQALVQSAGATPAYDDLGNVSAG